jgi:hypothetical protein
MVGINNFFFQGNAFTVIFILLEAEEKIIKIIHMANGNFPMKRNNSGMYQICLFIPFVRLIFIITHPIGKDWLPIYIAC